MRFPRVGLWTACLLAIAASAACARIPFEPISYPSVDELDPAAVRLEFSRSLPDSFVVFNSIVIRYRFQTITALGFTRANTNDGTFAVVGLMPTGMKLFEITGTSDSYETLFVQEELMERGDLPEAVAADIRRIYFDLVPSSNSTVTKKADRIVFSEPADGGRVDYVFAGPDGLLVEKQFYAGGQRVWTVSYHEYRRVGGELYAGGIVLRHHEYRYQLIVRLREVRS